MRYENLKQLTTWDTITLIRDYCAVESDRLLGTEHRHTATILNSLAELYLNQGRYADAEPLFKRFLAIREISLGPDHPEMAVILNNLAEQFIAQGCYDDAEPLYKRALAIREKALGTVDPLIAMSLDNLASLNIA